MSYRLTLSIFCVLVIGFGLWAISGSQEALQEPASNKTLTTSETVNAENGSTTITGSQDTEALLEAASNTTWATEAVNTENCSTTNEYILCFIVLFVLVLLCCNLSNQLLARIARNIFGNLRKVKTPESSPFLNVGEEEENNAEELGAIRSESDRVEVVCLPMVENTKKTKSKENSKIRTSAGYEMFVFNKAFDEEDHGDSSSEIVNSSVEQASSTNVAEIPENN